jgi:hypothetical protein
MVLPEGKLPELFNKLNIGASLGTIDEDEIASVWSAMITWMSKLCFHLATKQHSQILFTAAHLLEVILNRGTFAKHQFKVVALACLMSAEITLGSSEIHEKLQQTNEQTVKQLHEVAKQLSLYNNPHFSTAIHFLTEIYVGYNIFVDSSDLVQGKQIQSLPEISQRIFNYTERILILILKDFNLYFKYHASVLTAVAVATARKLVQVTPLWNSTLEKATNFSERDLVDGVDKVYQLVRTTASLQNSQDQKKA